MAEMEPRYVFPLAWNSLPNFSSGDVGPYSTLSDLPKEIYSSLEVDGARLRHLLQSKMGTGESIMKPPGLFYSLRVQTCSSIDPPPGLCFQEQLAGIEGRASGCLPSEHQRRFFSAAAPAAPRKRTCLEIARERSQRSRPERQNKTHEEQTEEDWNHREEKRTDNVNALKATAVYLDNQDYEPRPVTPNPARRLTKRRWETEIAQWRNDWREIDAVRKLVNLGFEENTSRAAWRNIKPKGKQSRLPHDQEAQLQDAANLLIAQVASEE
mmetsp:Transcript_36684/g.56865  ORF Transcript_36684/g.56865 Transcript_36684/m.56865 type:complete len:268 (+) Transcript_36684:50-853(+)